MTIALTQTPRLLVLTLISTLGFGGLTSLTAAPFDLTNRDRAALATETRATIRFLDDYHYRQSRFFDADPKEILDGYFEAIDGQKLFLTQEDGALFHDRFAGTLLPNYLSKGDLYPAFIIYNRYHERVMSRLDWVAERLEAPFDFTTERSYLPDRSEETFPTTVLAADELWERRLTYEVMSEILAELPDAIEGEEPLAEGPALGLRPAEMAAFDRAKARVTKRYERLRRFVNETEIHNVQETFLTAVAALYDPHSNFMSWDSAKDFEMSISNSLVGIGAQLRDVDGYCVIERLIPGGPAEMSGDLHPGDRIVAVGQGDDEPQDVVGLRLRRIVHQIRGEEETEVRLTILPVDGSERRVVSLIRDKVELTANLARAVIYDLPHGDQTLPIGVIDLPSFYGEGSFGENRISTSADVKELIDQLKDRGVEGIVLDLRNNPGGRLDEAVNLTGLFIPQGPVVIKRDSRGNVQEDWDRDPTVAWEGPLAVLVSRHSASASEIVAGALQQYRRAVVIGDKNTHGKGTVQLAIDLGEQVRRNLFSDPPEYGLVKMTIQKYYLPNGSSTQEKGVEPDIVLPSAQTLILDGEGDLPNALPWDTIEAESFRAPETGQEGSFLVSDVLLEGLMERSDARRNELPEFDFYQRQIDWVLARYERKDIPLSIETRRAQLAEDKAMSEAFDDERDDLRKKSLEADEIELALTEERERQHQAKLLATPLPNGESRVNRFYQKVYYYQAPESEEVTEIWVEYLDYEDLLDDAEALATRLTEASGREITPEEMTQILQRYNSLDGGSTFQALGPFENILGDDPFGENDDNAVLSAFFGAVIEVEPDIVDERMPFDIVLRESLRIVGDWLELAHPEKFPAPAATIAAKVDAPKPVDGLETPPTATP